MVRDSSLFLSLAAAHALEAEKEISRTNQNALMNEPMGAQLYWSCGFISPWAAGAHFFCLLSALEEGSPARGACSGRGLSWLGVTRPGGSFRLA